LDASRQSGSFSTLSMRQTGFGSGTAEPLPRTEANAASCSANDFWSLKKRKGFSTSQSRPPAELAVAPKLAMPENAQTAEASARIPMHASRQTAGYDSSAERARE